MLQSKQLKPAIGLIALSFIFFMACTKERAKEITIIPKPVSLSIEHGIFKVDSLSLFGENKHEKVKFIVDPTSGTDNPEGYELTIHPGGIILKAPDERGLFYGEQTLRQLYENGGVPYMTIKDEPRFKYRGLHLDVSRSFHTKEFVLKVLDIMAYYKLNVFHWHLTDNGGWRIQLDAY
ncbi:MAG: family 20 glycosylhydrolase, partial [Tannerellaceae bacterium]|nr:family 20 glycosylhydrolase [Tannerellaceae bacterium]